MRLPILKGVIVYVQILMYTYTRRKENAIRLERSWVYVGLAGVIYRLNLRPSRNNCVTFMESQQCLNTEPDSMETPPLKLNLPSKCFHGFVSNCECSRTESTMAGQNRFSDRESRTFLHLNTNCLGAISEETPSFLPAEL